MRNAILCVIAASSLAACASTETVADNSQPQEEKIYVTGSMLPKSKDRMKDVKTVAPEDMGNAIRGASPAAVSTGGKGG